MPRQSNQQDQQASAGEVRTEDVRDPGIRPQQGTPTEQLGDVREHLAYAPDRELHPSGEPDHPADRTSVNGPENPPLHRPPVASPRPDAELVRTLATGAGAHEPPNPDEYNADGSPKQGQ
jgi:hypothetical protein